MHRVVIVGANGALGRVLSQTLSGAGLRVARLDVVPEDTKADAKSSYAPFYMQLPSDPSALNVQDILSQLRSKLGQEPIDAVINVAGGWVGGNAADPNLLSATTMSFNQSVVSSTLAAQLAALLPIQAHGLVVLPGALAALQSIDSRDGTPYMLAYGAAKAAVHHMVHSLSGPESGLPASATVLGIAPGVIDTPGNRAAMTPDDSWVAPEHISNTILQWIVKPADRPRNGSIVPFTGAK
eukprot:TRINITY_DN7035_c0_g1_i1.p1 TRINITY_DN7035_c0_g1~~TRINITY_DN7035_c0_g1_i1.p1  ORF type:complete len:239 (-),score=46.04 TRINITY_DN7035_c0_g1_i1:428-1144(-)